MQIINNKIAHSLTLMRNEKLYELCRLYGERARMWRQKFIGLLPEVNRRRLYEAKGFSSIFEFAAKLCGLSAEQVRLALNLEKRFEDKPVLKKMLENGEASINKLARVVAIATPENEEELAQKIKILPKSALETFVRDVKGAAASARAQTDGNSENTNGLAKPLFGVQSLPGQNALAQYLDLPVQTQLNFELADDIKKQLNELHTKGIDVNELLREILKQRQEKIAQAKQKIAEKIQEKNQRIGQTRSRYIPVQIKKILREEHGKKCSIPACKRPAKIIHHSQRFSLSQNHDPRFLAPLCREHHAIAHSIDLKYQKARRCHPPA